MGEGRRCRRHVADATDVVFAVADHASGLGSMVAEGPCELVAQIDVVAGELSGLVSSGVVLVAGYLTAGTSGAESDHQPASR